MTERFADALGDEKRLSQVESALANLKGVRRSGAGWVALCPAHADKNASLSIHQKGERILLHCFAGCTFDTVLTAAGIKAQELFTDGHSKQAEIVAMYDYLDEQGALLYQTVRYRPKHFRQRRPNGKGRWIWNLKGTRRVLYRLPEVLAANDVLICEGEKDCETGRELGFIATCNPHGAGKWRDEYSETLRGKRVTIIADSDEPGRQHAQQIADSLSEKAASFKVLEVPRGKDLSEWVESGGTKQDLLDLVAGPEERKPQVVEGSALLDQMLLFIRRFVYLSETQARVVSLWIIHTHAFSAADATPYLAVNSAEKQSGKTRLLEVLEILVAKPWFTGRVTAAVLTRKIDAEQPDLTGLFCTR